MHRVSRDQGTGKKLFFSAVFFLCAGILMGGCGKPTADSEESPVLTGASLESWNDGSMDEQYVDVSLEFDRPVCWQEKDADTLRVTISGNRMSGDDLELVQGESDQELILRISVTAVTNGTLEIGMDDSADVISAVTSEDGKYAADDFQISAVIPSGIELADTSDQAGSSDGHPQISKQVTHSWNIRSIAWVQLLENGEPVEVGEDTNIEILDQAVAVHGHEFLQEDEFAVAQSIAETLDDYYSDDYAFSYADDVVTVEKVSGDQDVELDLQVYSYFHVTSQGSELDVSGTAEEETGEHEESLGSKVKETEIDREMTDQEQAFVDSFHISHMDDPAAAEAAYRILTLTGDALGEEEVYSVYNLETLASLCFQNQKMNEINFTAQEDHTSGESCDCQLKGHTLQGLDFTAFLELAGVDFSKPVYAACYAGAASGLQQEVTEVSRMIPLSDENGTLGQKVMLVTAVDGQPLTEGQTVLSGPVALVVIRDGETVCVDSLAKVVLGNEENPENPNYGYHRYEPYSESADAAFTVNVYDSSAPYLGTLISKTFTTADIEALMEQYPEHVYRNYYGLIGNQEEFASMGVGGWQDCFTGLDLYWLLSEQVGIETFSGYAEFYGRDDDLYLTLDDISYFNWQDRAEQYNVINRNGEVIPYAIPMISCVKNGYPILPEHDHESEGSVDYNQLNVKLEELGISTSVGEVKNDKGPFVACLGNLSGVFGGYQQETGGDCVRLDIYLD